MTHPSREMLGLFLHFCYHLVALVSQTLFAQLCTGIVRGDVFLLHSYIYIYIWPARGVVLAYTTRPQITSSSCFSSNHLSSQNMVS